MNGTTTLAPPQHRRASTTPLEDIELITATNNPEQPAHMRGYRTGYENFFNEIPVMDPDDPLLGPKIKLTTGIMDALVDMITIDGWAPQQQLGPNNFARSILALESPRQHDGRLSEGTEILVAHWGEGFTSPVHGHAPGYEYEAIISGRILVNTYRMLAAHSNSVRLVSSVINDKPGRFISWYADPRKQYAFPRALMIHNFTALEPTATLHYLTEHTRDGRDNGFNVQYFEDSYPLSRLTPLTAQEGLGLKVGEVALIRSANVPEYGDHYIVITGHPVIKPHGLRPQENTIIAPHASRVLDQFDDGKGLTILKLDDRGREAFHRFHGIKMENGGVVLPDSSPITI